MSNLNKTNQLDIASSGFVNNIFEQKIMNKELVMKIYQYQYQNNQVYQRWCDAIARTPDKVTQVTDIPFLPISFFKTHQVITGDFIPESIYKSSSTTGSGQSNHFVKNNQIYRSSFTRAFKQFYGDPSEWCIIGLLPSYLERSDSSLIVMVDELMQLSGNSSNGFYLYEFSKLNKLLQELETKRQKTLLIGVTFALLDFAEAFPMQLRSATVMETGGMKGRREELTRPQVHEILKKQLGVSSVHSEYGMTELLSQAYSKGEGVFAPPAWMKVLVREEEDPLQVSVMGKGVLNIIDMANIFSCAFLATDDVGTVYGDGSFEVSGRMDNSDMRGCSLMAV